jgi:hypothetical protein
MFGSVHAMKTKRPPFDSVKKYVDHAQLCLEGVSAITADGIIPEFGKPFGNKGKVTSLIVIYFYSKYMFLFI